MLWQSNLNPALLSQYIVICFFGCNSVVCCVFLWCCLFVRNVLFVMLHWCVLDDAVMAPRLKRHHRSRRSAAVSILPDLLHHCRSVIFCFESLSQELLTNLLIFYLLMSTLNLAFVQQLRLPNKSVLSPTAMIKGSRGTDRAFKPPFSVKFIVSSHCPPHPTPLTTCSVL